MSKVKYIINDNKVYEACDNPLFTTWKLCDVPKREPLPIWKGPLIPFQIWEAILQWLHISYQEEQSETMCFLFYDQDNSEWHWGVLPQITNGMTVKSDPDHAKYNAFRKQYPSLQFGTVHHHCKSSAFASGTDQADEANREGVHFTVGFMDKEIYDLHCRITLGDATTVIPAESMIAYHPDVAKLPKRLQATVHKEMCKLAPDVDKETLKKHFENELKLVSRPKWGQSHLPLRTQSHWNQPNGFAGQVQKKGTTTSNGNGTKKQTNGSEAYTDREIEKETEKIIEHFIPGFINTMNTRKCFNHFLSFLVEYGQAQNQPDYSGKELHAALLYYRHLHTLTENDFKRYTADPHELTKAIFSCHEESDFIELIHDIVTDEDMGFDTDKFPRYAQLQKDLALSVYPAILNGMLAKDRQFLHEIWGLELTSPISETYEEYAQRVLPELLDLYNGVTTV